MAMYVLGAMVMLSRANPCGRYEVEPSYSPANMVWKEVGGQSTGFLPYLSASRWKDVDGEEGTNGHAVAKEIN